MSLMLKVSGHSNLSRDVRSGVIINNNRAEYEAYIARRDAMVNKDAEILRQANELNNIKSELAAIREMIAGLGSNK
jgi:hypothetical protein